MTVSPNLLEVQRLAAGYGRVPVVRDVTFALPAGAAVGLVGHNGAGKTTLFRALVGQLPPLAGSITLRDPDGRSVDVTRLPLSARARLGLGYLPQRPALLWDLSPRDNLVAALRAPAAANALRWAGAAPSDLVDHTLDRVGLADAPCQPAAQLSGGQIKRLSIARLLVMRSRLWLCDEPFAGLDAESVEIALVLLTDAVRDGVAMLITEHRVDLLGRLVQSTLRVEDGQLLPSLATADRPSARSTFIATAMDLSPVER